ncbi:hypothetical protein GCM10010193_62770 [Kitasatospora atroaurantiaca]|uniref:transposase n=2 Tax=Streptomycetaceae TaxID=2062 RepID=UPI00337E32E3
MVQENGVPVGMKHYPAEFKADAVALYRSRPGATIKSVAGDLGVNTETLRNWIRAADGRRPGAHSSAPACDVPVWCQWGVGSDGLSVGGVCAGRVPVSCFRC